MRRFVVTTGRCQDIPPELYQEENGQLYIGAIKKAMDVEDELERVLEEFQREMFGEVFLSKDVIFSVCESFQDGHDVELRKQKKRMLCMILFYATSFDSIAYTAACYSYKRLGENEKPHTMITLLWCMLLIVLPIALVFSESSMNNIQSVSIISAFPIGIIMILMIWSFFKDAKKYREEKELK